MLPSNKKNINLTNILFLILLILYILIIALANTNKHNENRIICDQEHNHAAYSILKFQKNSVVLPKNNEN